MPRLVRAGFAVLLLLALVVPAAGAEETAPCTDEAGDLALEETAAWFAPGATKAGNLGGLGVTDFPTWDDTAPTQSVQEGAGGGYLTNSANFVAEDPETQKAVGFTAVGPSSGCLDTLLIDLYAFLPTNRSGTSGNLEEADFTGIVSIQADGKPLVFAQEVDFAMVANDGGDATYRLRLAVTGIHERMLRRGIDPEGDRELELLVEPRYINTDHALFVYDTTEVPAGLLFNGTPDDSYASIRA
jgi:hypothetical protein